MIIDAALLCPQTTVTADDGVAAHGGVTKVCLSIYIFIYI